MELRPVLADCLAHGITIVGNFGAANPDAAARVIQQLAAELKLTAPRIAVVKGDDLSGSNARPILRLNVRSRAPGYGFCGGVAGPVKPPPGTSVGTELRRAAVGCSRR